MARDPYKYFRIEAQELVDQLNRAALDLEKGGGAETVARLLRLAHTLKGAARVVRRADIGDCAHAIEDELAPLRGADRQASRAQVEAVLARLDEIAARLASLNAGAEATPAAAEGPSRPQAAGDEGLQMRTVRVDIGEMDGLIDGLSESYAHVDTLREGLRRADSLHGQFALLGGEPGLPSVRSRAGAQWRGAFEQLGAAFDDMRRQLAAGIERLDRELGQVREAAERMRLVPADSLFVALERVVRDAAQFQGKQVAFATGGGDVRLDAQVLADIQGALSHAVRNAVTHGIEAPAARRAAGKTAEGRVTLTIGQRGKWIEFSCRDDGAGIDLAAVRRVAEQRQPAAAPRDERALLQLLLRGGISTADSVTELAGRGVGLDAVRDAVERLDGRVDLETQQGKGTTVKLAVPLLAASVEGLLVEAGGIRATLPIAAVRAVARIPAREIAHASGGESIMHGGGTMPFVPLRAALAAGGDGNGGGRPVWPAVVLQTAAGAAAVGVDRLLGTVSAVMRPLPPLAPASPVVAGVSLDAQGNPQLVLDPESLVLAARDAAVARPLAPSPALPILVVDDSLTTRMLERSILESAGYAVELAVSAEDALEKAASKRYALFLVDVEMPGMDGFAFIEQVRAHPDWRDTPAILVTSLASEAHLRRGREVGAQGYMVKSEFDQEALLAQIAGLLGEAAP